MLAVPEFQRLNTIGREQQLEPVVFTHPLSTLSDEAIQAKALDASSQILRVLSTGP